MRDELHISLQRKKLGGWRGNKDIEPVDENRSGMTAA